MRCKLLPNNFFIRPSTMPGHEHDRPDPNLIVHGSRRPQPSKRGLGNDYPITPLEELRERDKCKQINIANQEHRLTFCVYQQRMTVARDLISEMIARSSRHGKRLLRGLEGPSVVVFPKTRPSQMVTRVARTEH